MASPETDPRNQNVYPDRYPNTNPVPNGRREPLRDPANRQVPLDGVTGQTVEGTAAQRPVVYSSNDYERGRIAERHDVEQERLVRDNVRDNDNAARGLLLGILLTSLLGAALATAFYLTQRNEAPTPNTPVVPNEAPRTQQSPQVQERIIERDRVVPVPQQQQAPASPNVIVVPGSEGSTGQQAPAAQPAQPAAPQSTTPNNSTTGTTGTTPSNETTDTAPNPTNGQSDSTTTSPATGQ